MMTGVLNIANLITFMRLLCVPFFITSVLYLEAGRLYLHYVPLAIFAVAIVSDALDGFLARVLNQRTKLGAWLDPLADKLLLISSFVLFGAISNMPQLKLPIWLVALVISRDIIIVLGAVFVHMFKGVVHLAPSYLGKITTFFQMMVILARLADINYFKNELWAVAAFFTLASGLDYILKGLKQLNVK